MVSAGYCVQAGDFGRRAAGQLWRVVPAGMRGAGGGVRSAAAGRRPHLRDQIRVVQSADHRAGPSGAACPFSSKYHSPFIKGLHTSYM